MNEIIEKGHDIEKLIYEIRGVQVMLDSDLARLYGCSNGTKTINLAVKRNIEKFPNDFYFQLTEEEYNNLKFQIGTSSLSNYGGIRKLPHVFTEEGVAMLASVLHTSVANEMSIKIIRTFVRLRRFISNSLIEQKYINNLVLKHDRDIKKIQESFDMINDKNQISTIFYEGQIYDAYSLLIDVLNKSKKEIIIIDNYIDKKLLDILTKINKEIIIITNKYNNTDYEKYKIQYSNVTIKIDNSFHDRFIILDNNTLYHCGASFKDLGKKCFATTKIEDNKILTNLLEKIY